MKLQPRYIVGAVLLHVLLFVFLFVSAHFTRKMEPPAVIQAVFVQPGSFKLPPPTPPAVDQKKLEEKKLEQEKLQQQKIEHQKQQEQKRLEQQKIAQEQAQQVAEQKRKVEEQKKIEEQQKRAEQQEQKRLIEEEQKRIADEKRKQKERLEAQMRSDLQKQLTQETDQRAAAAQRLRQATWTDKIAAAIRRNWIRPYNSPDQFQCKVQVQLLPSGNVVSAKVTESCGNPALDKSVEAAVYKSDPLPLPDNPDDFDRNITVIFQPNP